MVHLYGVVPDLYWESPFVKRIEAPRLAPTPEFIKDLSQLPRGTRIGFAELSKNEFEELRRFYSDLPFNPSEPEDAYTFHYHFPSKPCLEFRKDYWDNLEMVCLNFDFEIVFLDSLDLNKELNRLKLKKVENDSRRWNLNVWRRKEEKYIEYSIRAAQLNLEEYQEEVFIRKLLEIEREKHLLEKIKSSKTDVAIVPRGYSDFWFVNPQTLGGLKIESYSAEVIHRNVQPNDLVLNHFVRDVGDADSIVRKNVGNRLKLEREIRLFEKGRLFGKKPDYTGTWNTNNSPAGYFEMFVDSTARDFRGQIIDFCGEAEFQGTLEKGRFQFVKKYEDKGLNNVFYEGEIRGNNLFGVWQIPEKRLSLFFYAGSDINVNNLGSSWILFPRKYNQLYKKMNQRLDSIKREHAGQNQ